jgi:adenylate cyclase
MGADSTKRRLAAIFSADAVGYSRLMARDDRATVRTLEAHRDILGSRVRQFGGRVVDEAGDSLLAEFPSAADAVGCALEVQRALGERNAELPESQVMAFRIGVHLGDVLVAEDRIYGDGVNIAARLQALADPGGICISGTVYDQVRSHYGELCEDRGEQRLKNIDRPVRTYRLGSTDRRTPAGSDLTVPGFGGRPAIAILAFDNMSNDPDQEYFGDGIAEDLITHLSCMGRLPVISRNSSFSYKGRSVDIVRVSRELGARYVVEGSVRRAGSRVRINAQLIDATTGHHLWAERYDRELDDIFALQDEITETIAKALAPVVGSAERRRILGRAPESLDAWDCLQRAQWHFRQLTPDNNRIVKTFCRRALELDPGFADAKAFLAVSFLFDIFNFWTEEPDAAARECLRNAEEAVGLDESSPTCREALGWARVFAQDPERAVAEFERALALNPSFARAHWGLGVALYSRDRADEAVAAIEKAIRLSRNDPMLNLFEHNLGMAHFVAGRYERAAECARRSIALNPDLASPQRLLAASCGLLGRIDDARLAIAELRRISPDFSAEAFRQANPVVADSMLEGLRKAGWTES